MAGKNLLNLQICLFILYLFVCSRKKCFLSNVSLHCLFALHLNFIQLFINPIYFQKSVHKNKNIWMSQMKKKHFKVKTFTTGSGSISGC